MTISDFFIRGDIRGAIAYMRDHAEFRDILPQYTAIFEDEQYRHYGLPDRLEQILTAYQVYYRDIFYCGRAFPEAEAKLFSVLRVLADLPDADENVLAPALQALFERDGYHALFGRTQGIFGPYVWRETVPVVYAVELPDSVEEYTVNILKDFVFRSWMDYLTFGRFGTGGWASPDGTINCIEQAYDFESEKFRVSLLKHEAQHASDMKHFPGIESAELEYRAKLVELIYTQDCAGLLEHFLEAADEGKTDDGHAVASVRLLRAFADLRQPAAVPSESIRTRAAKLLRTDTRTLVAKYSHSAD